MGSRVIRARDSGHFRSRASLVPRLSLSDSWLALVSRHVGPGHWARTSWRPGAGGPVHVHPYGWSGDDVSLGRVGCARAVASNQAEVSRSGGHGMRGNAGTDHGPTSILAKQPDFIRTCSQSD